MMWTSDWENDSGEDGVEGGELDVKVRVMYMHVGRGTVATHEFVERCARGEGGLPRTEGHCRLLRTSSVQE